MNILSLDKQDDKLNFLASVVVYSWNFSKHMVKQTKDFRLKGIIAGSWDNLLRTVSQWGSDVILVERCP